MANNLSPAASPLTIDQKNRLSRYAVTDLESIKNRVNALSKLHSWIPLDAENSTYGLRLQHTSYYTTRALLSRQNADEQLHSIRCLELTNLSEWALRYFNTTDCHTLKKQKAHVDCIYNALYGCKHVCCPQILDDGRDGVALLLPVHMSNLEAYNQRFRSLKTETQYMLIQQLFMAVQKIHYYKYLHPNIQPSIIFIDEDEEKTLQLCLGNIVNVVPQNGYADKQPVTISPDYCSPELWSEDQPDRADHFIDYPTTSSDIFSLGVTLAEILDIRSLMPPYLHKIRKPDDLWASDLNQAAIPAQASSVVDLIAKMTLKQPLRRPGISDILAFWKTHKTEIIKAWK